MSDSSDLLTVSVGKERLKWVRGAGKDAGFNPSKALQRLIDAAMNPAPAGAHGWMHQCGRLIARAESIDDAIRLREERPGATFAAAYVLMVAPVGDAPDAPPRPSASPIMDAVRARPGLAHITRTDHDLLVEVLRSTLGWEPGQPRWSHVRLMAGHGSGVGHALCVAVGLDPDELGPTKEEEEWEVSDG